MIKSEGFRLKPQYVPAGLRDPTWLRRSQRPSGESVVETRSRDQHRVRGAVPSILTQTWLWHNQLTDKKKQNKTKTQQQGSQKNVRK